MNQKVFVEKNILKELMFIHGNTYFEKIECVSLSGKPP